MKLLEVYLREADCPECGTSGAYVGFNDVDCKNSRCRHFGNPNDADLSATNFDTFKHHEPKMAKDAIDFYQKNNNLDTLKNMIFRKNHNGSWEGWPTGHSYNGVDVFDPKTGEWGNSDYADDDWLDKLTGIKNWRDSVKDPGEGK